MGKSSIVVSFVSCLLSLAAVAASDYPIRSAKLADAKVTGGFWFDRLETNRLVTLKTDFAKCNETPRVANFTNAAAPCRSVMPTDSTRWSGRSGRWGKPRVLRRQARRRET